MSLSKTTNENKLAVDPQDVVDSSVQSTNIAEAIIDTNTGTHDSGDIDDATSSPLEITNGNGGELAVETPIDGRKADIQRAKREHERISAFKENREQWTYDWLEKLDEKLTGGVITAINKGQGAFSITWNPYMLSCASTSLWVVRDEASVIPGGLPIPRWSVGIVMAERLVSNKWRLQNTLAHEFCHILTATFPIYEAAHASGEGTVSAPAFVDPNKRNKFLRAHNKEWHSWMEMAAEMFPDAELSMDMSHKYKFEGEYRYAWQCSTPACGKLWERHMNSFLKGRRDDKCDECGGLIKIIRPAPRPVKSKGAADKSVDPPAKKGAAHLAEFNNFRARAIQQFGSQLGKTPGQRSRKILQMWKASRKTKAEQLATTPNRE